MKWTLRHPLSFLVRHLHAPAGYFLCYLSLIIRPMLCCVRVCPEFVQVNKLKSAKVRSWGNVYWACVAGAKFVLHPVKDDWQLLTEEIINILQTSQRI